jgi:hypothetical protein
LRFGVSLSRARCRLDGPVLETGDSASGPGTLPGGRAGARLDDEVLLDGLHKEDAAALTFFAVDIRGLAVLIEAALDHLQGQKGVSLLA